MRTIVEHPRCWAVAIAIAVMGGPAAAQRTVFQADGTVNVGYIQTTRDAVPPDPNADAADVPASSSAGFFTEIRPGISLQTGSPRLSWRLAYQFSGNVSTVEQTRVTPAGGQMGMPTGMPAAAPASTPLSAGYANAASVALAAQPTQFTVVTLSGAATQGGTSFLQSQVAPEMGKPQLRAPGNPATVGGTLAEALSWEVGRQLSLQQGLLGNASAPQNDLGRHNSSVNGTLALERLFTRDSAGVELRGNISWLRPLLLTAKPYTTYTNGAFGRWNHDINWRWNAFAMVGVEQVYVDTGSRPVGFLPAGSASVRYTVGNAVAALDFSHGTATNLQIGAISLSDQVAARGVITLDVDKRRVVSFSAGFLHNAPLGEVAAVAASAGNAVQGDAGFTTAITKDIVASARYSVAYQFGLGASLGNTLAHVFFVGVTATYSNLPRDARPMPGRGLRVDRGDIEGFPVVDPIQTP